MEHRWGQRSNCDVAIRLRPRNGTRNSEWIQGDILDVSASGALISSRLKVPLFGRLEVSMAGELIDANVVRHAGLDATGVEWEEFAPSPVIALLSMHSGPSVWHDWRAGVETRF
jgi:hypothetical protein